ncbi:unnamed protein product [Rotaria magnacalcarata]|uniref:G-protein coupled receptors family 1 profile domain-containing protein n=1 Tax=Rotaria magnacalcarata TaxID=392030 RepID=A0A816DJ74_9BILA|nr:unnamed protein product [Rotaria magnacalcarata]CAF4417823.1 unnamed protein product [Rotaria magnacalcarata]
MSSTDTSAIASWNNLSDEFNRYFSIIIFLFGTIGNILNIIVLSQRQLRTNPCSLFFLISSIANLSAILSGLTTRMLSGWALDLTNTIDWLCKTRAFALFLSRNVASWLLMLATLDRWLLSCRNDHHREMNALKNVYCGIIMTIFLSTCLYCVIFYCYEANLTDAPLECYGKTLACRFINDLSYACLTILLPMSIMFIFGLMTIRNIHNVKKRIQVGSTNEKRGTRNSPVVRSSTRDKQKKLDCRLFFMLFIQIILMCIFTLPQAVQKLYSTLTSAENQTPLTKAIENFVFNLFLLMTYVAHGMPFYIYAWSGGTIFRNEIKTLIKKYSKKWFN